MPAHRHRSRSRLHRWAADTWHSLDAMTDPATGLPADNIPESLAAGDRSGYTSPTNIGGYLWSTVVARELGIISTHECTARLTRTLRTLQRMEHHAASGMFFNWYDPATGGTLHTWPDDGSHVEPFVSSVDSGWLGAALLVVSNAAARPPASPAGCSTGCAGTPSTTPARSRATPTVRPGGLMHGGFYPFADGRPGGTFLGTHIGGDPVWLTTHHYDTIVSETRITSYLGILTGQVPGHHYYAPWRTFPASCDWSWHEMQPVGQTRRYLGIDVYEGAYTYRGMHIVPGWGGSMFEELMPAVFVPEEEWAPRSWGVNHPLHVRAEREHGLLDARYGYWGFSPSSNPAGGYREYGVDALGLNPEGYFSDQEKTDLDLGFGDCRPATNPDPTYGDGVVTPHASFLAMMFERDAGDHQPRAHPGRARGLRRGRLLRRRRDPQRHRRPALPLARPGHGHGRAGQRAGPWRAAKGLQHQACREGAAARHRHRAVRGGGPRRRMTRPTRRTTRAAAWARQHASWPSPTMGAPHDEGELL